MSPEKEAEIFCRYLIGRPADELTIRLYIKAIEIVPYPLSQSDEKIISFALNNTWSIRMLDAAAALLQPHGELRRRLYYLLSILECNPKHCDLFLTKDRNPFYLIVILLKGIRSVISALVGIVLLKIVC